MSIEKIISSGRPGAEQAALDVALKLGIPHGGWAPAGRKPAGYRLEAMALDDEAECVVLNVKASKATLIITPGKLSHELDAVRKATLRQQHQLLGIDLTQTDSLQAASLVNDWIQLRRIDVLYVTGPQPQFYPDIAAHTTLILESALRMDLLQAPPGAQAMDYNPNGPLVVLPALSQTVAAAVEAIIAAMPLKERATLAAMTLNQLKAPDFSLEKLIAAKVLLTAISQKIAACCQDGAGAKFFSETTAAAIIVEKLWERLKDTHRLRVVK